MKLERIFADKVFAAEAYWLSGDYLDSAKHVFDLVVLSNQPRIRCLISNEQQSTAYFSYRRREELVRLDSSLSELNLREAKFFNAPDNPYWIDAFNQMQNIYVFDGSQRMSVAETKHGLEIVRTICFNDHSHEGYCGRAASSRDNRQNRELSLDKIVNHSARSRNSR